MKKVIACIIVRLKSQRLQKKALADLNGKPMLLQLIDRLRTSKTITDIVLCTSTNPEDAPLLEKAQEWGVKAYAGHELDVLSRLMEVARKYKADAVLRITGDNPFTDAENIDRVVNHHFATGADYTRTAHLPLGVTAEAMTPAMMDKLHALMPDPNQSEYMSFFSFNPDIFHCEVLQPEKELDRPYYSLTVDYPEELELARSLYKRLESKGPVPSLRDVIAILDSDPNYKGVDKNFPIKMPLGETITYEALIKELDELADKANRKKASAR
jgi:spore coat polysaccharide biosynthesis protein SpsF